MDYKNDPLWKQAVEMQAEAHRELCSWGLRTHFDENHEDLANVVLAYFNDKPAIEMIRFAESLRKVAEGSAEITIFCYKHNASIDEAQELLTAAEQRLDELWAKKYGDLTHDTDSSKESEKKLNVFERILNRCVLFLKGK